MTRAPLLTLDELVLRVRCVTEREVRRAEIRRWTRFAEPESVTAVIDGLLERAMKPDPEAQLTALAVADFLTHVDDEDRLALEALDLAAVRAGHQGAALLFSAHPPFRELSEEARRNVRLKRHVSLGARRWRARLQDRGWLEVLMADLDSEVVANLCANPKLTLQDILQMASKRPNTAEVLDEIARSRWLTRDVVRRALVQNPYVRTGLAISLLPMLTLNFLAALRFSGQVHEAVREMACYLLARSPIFEE